MSLGNVLLRPQLVMPPPAPTVRQLDLMSDLGMRLGRALLTDQATRAIFTETFQSLSTEFLRKHEIQLERALDRLLGLVQPAVEAISDLTARLGSAEAVAVPGVVLDLLCQLLQGLSPQRIEAALDQLLGVIEDDLDAIVRDLAAGLLDPIFDGLSDRLQADHLAGDASPVALTRYVLARDIVCLRHMIMDALPEIELDRAAILQPLRRLLDRLGLDKVSETGALACEAIRGAGELLQTLFSARFSLSAGVSASAAAPKAARRRMAGRGRASSRTLAANTLSHSGRRHTLGRYPEPPK